MAKKLDVKTVQITFRAPAPVVEQLDELCRMTGMKRSDFFINAVTSEYDRVQGNPQLKKMMEQMRQIAETMKEMTGSSGSGLSAGSEHGEASE